MFGTRNRGQRLILGCPICLAFVALSLSAQPFHLPTANRAIFEPGREAEFFVGTVGKPWTSGQFGCVRSEGWQLHEGLDIRCLERDRQGESTDPVMSTADGEVVYCSHKPGLSNYGRYVVIRHPIEKLEVFSLYAHLREIGQSIHPGLRVKAGDVIGIMGRSANTRQGISRERAHLHFELNLLISDRFDGWFKSNPRLQGATNDHGIWNGLNLLGMDPLEIFQLQEQMGKNFSLLQYLRNQTELCRILVPQTDFPWLRRYPYLIKRNNRAFREGIAAYEIALNYTGIPFLLIPRAASELEEQPALKLLSVNEAWRESHRCGKILNWRSDGTWEFTQRGIQHLEKLTY